MQTAYFFDELFFSFCARATLCFVKRIGDEHMLTAISMLSQYVIEAGSGTLNTQI